MQNTRTLTLFAWLMLATSLAPIGLLDDAPADAPVAAMVSDLAPAAAPGGSEPWRADYPARSLIDGAVVYAATAALVDDVRWALDRFHRAGLSLPTVEVWIHADPSGCRGPDGTEHAGYYARRNGTHVIFSCGSRFTVLHELAHVWDHTSLTDEVRAAFLTERGLTQWHTTWSRSGAEHLANVIAWGLDEAHTRPMSTRPADDASLLAAYRIATGADPLGAGDASS